MFLFKNPRILHNRETRCKPTIFRVEQNLFRLCREGIHPV